VSWVFAALVTAPGQAWVDCWAKEPQRRKRAGIPGDLAFATKPEPAIAQVSRLMAAGVRAMWPPPIRCTAGAASSGPRSGDWVFLEINPNGQWAWIENETGLPIASAIADALTGQET